MQQFDPYALPDGKHFGKDPRHPKQVYIVSHHHGVPVVSEYEAGDLEHETAHSCRFNDEICQFNTLEDCLDWIDEQVDEAEREERDPEGRPWR